MLETKKQIVERFINAHKDILGIKAGLACDKTIRKHYSNLISDGYGTVHTDGASSEFYVEICAVQSISGNPYLFEWDSPTTELTPADVEFYKDQHDAYIQGEQSLAEQDECDY